VVSGAKTFICNGAAQDLAELNYTHEDPRRKPPWRGDHQHCGAGQEVKFTLAQFAAKVAAGQPLLTRRCCGTSGGGSAAATRRSPSCTALRLQVGWWIRWLALSHPSTALRGDLPAGNAYLDGRVSRIYG